MVALPRGIGRIDLLVAPCLSILVLLRGYGSGHLLVTANLLVRWRPVWAWIELHGRFVSRFCVTAIWLLMLCPRVVAFKYCLSRVGQRLMGKLFCQTVLALTRQSRCALRIDLHLCFNKLIVLCRLEHGIFQCLLLLISNRRLQTEVAMGNLSSWDVQTWVYNVLGYCDFVRIVLRLVGLVLLHYTLTMNKLKSVFYLDYYVYYVSIPC